MYHDLMVPPSASLIWNIIHAFLLPKVMEMPAHLERTVTYFVDVIYSHGKIVSYLTSNFLDIYTVYMHGQH